MERLFSFILLVVVLVVVAFYIGWFDFTSSTTNNQRVDVGLSVDKEKMRQDLNRAEQRAREMAENARREARGLARRVETATRREGTFTLDNATVQISQGWSKSVSVTREDNDPSAYSLVLKTEPDSKLLVKGGEFKDGQKETTITIEAPADAYSGVISVEGYGKSEPIMVIVN